MNYPKVIIGTEDNSGNFTSAAVSKGGGVVDATTTRVTLATDGPGVAALASIDAKTPALVNGLQPVEPLGSLLAPKQLPAGSATANTALTPTCRRVTIKARFSDIRFAVGSSAQTANASNSHFIAMDERLDFAVPANANIAVIRDTLSTVDGKLEVSEMS